MQTRATEKLTTAFKSRKKWYRMKHQVAKKFSNAGDEITAQKLRNCQETESLVMCGHCGKTWWVTTRCKLRVCPLCEYEVAKRRAQLLINICNGMTAPKQLTLTLPTRQGELRSGIKKLRTAWNKLRRAQVMRRVRGGAYHIEAKPKPDGWHVHMHILLDTPYLPYQRIFTAWRKILGVKYCSIDIRAAQATAQKAYVAKHTTKNIHMEGMPEDIVEWYEQTKGLRLFEVFGLFRAAYRAQEKAAKEERKKHALCPHCGSVGKMFYARDGPRVFGIEWRNVMPKEFLTSNGLRPIAEIVEETNKMQLAEDEKEGSGQLYAA